MSKIIYDVIQRFEVENGVPRLVSTNIQVIQGGEDLLSLAIDMLAQMGFYAKFEEKRTSQYIGYRLKNAGKGEKRYQLVLAQRKEVLYISIPYTAIKPDLLVLNWQPFLGLEELEKGKKIDPINSALYWVIPNKSTTFLQKAVDFQSNMSRIMTEIISSTGSYSFKDYDFQEIRHFFKLMESEQYCLELTQDTLFPYALQLCITTKEVLEEFLNYFGKIIMDQKQCLSNLKD